MVKNGHLWLAFAQGVAYLCLVPNQFRWQKGAACNGVPSYIFFPEERAFEGFRENPLFENKTAADYCTTCPVRQICLEFSLLHDAEGIWGNTTERKRAQLYCKDERYEMRDDREEIGIYWPLYGHE